MKECLEKLEVPLTEAHKITLNKVVADLKAMKVKKSIDDYVEEFYKVFEFTSDERAKRYPMLMELYINFMREIQNMDKNYRLLDELQEDWTEEQKQLFNEYCEVISQMDGEIEEQIFIFSIILAKEFDRECKIVKNQA